MMTLSIDWEDFGQLFGKYRHKVISEPVNGAIERQTDVILDLLDETGNKATFFILGMLARHRPQLVKKIASRGHEVGVHGQNHESMYSLSRASARKDLECAYKTITDIVGAKVYGYRAPFFSINKTNLYMLEILADMGFTYDSSIFPMKLPRYGIDDFNEEAALYKLANGKEIVELPLTVSTWLGRKWPVSGGGYIRLMPEFLVNRVFDGLHKKNMDGMLYIHPYEIDPEPIDVSANYIKGTHFSKLNVRAQNLRWNIFRGSVYFKIKRLLARFKFTTCLERATYVKGKTDGSSLLGQ
jgi:polysaccharide deacetylase family protein (PEP-CTERM system associated)